MDRHTQRDQLAKNIFTGKKQSTGNLSIPRHQSSIQTPPVYGK